MSPLARLPRSSEGFVQDRIFTAKKQFSLQTTTAPSTVPFSTGADKLNLSDNKYSARVDANSRFGLLTAYYYGDRYNRLLMC